MASLFFLSNQLFCYCLFADSRDVFYLFIYLLFLPFPCWFTPFEFAFWFSPTFSLCIINIYVLFSTFTWWKSKEFDRIQITDVVFFFSQ